MVSPRPPGTGRSVGDAGQIAIGALQGLGASTVFVLVLFIGFCVVVGFTIKDGADAIVDIGGASFPFFTKNDGAWMKNAAEEARLIDALRKGRDFTIKSTSLRGNATNDRYSLSGIGQALDRVDQECK